jgi:hypothetical protein
MNPLEPNSGTIASDGLTAVLDAIEKLQTDVVSAIQTKFP